MKTEEEIKYEPKRIPVSTEPAPKVQRSRISRPKIELKKCKKCMLCIVYCPDRTIEINKAGNPNIIYDRCKGCLICLRECPYMAISEERE